MGRWRLGIGLAIVAMLIAVPGAAQAQQRSAKFEVRRANASGSMYLGKSRGYLTALLLPTDRIAVFLAARIERRKDQPSISVFRYAAHTRGSLADGTVRGRFGSLGSFSLRFRPNGHVREIDGPEGCEGQPEVTEYGRFVGHVAFHGEGNYLDLSSSGRKGRLSRTPRRVCEEGQSFGPAPERLRAYVVPGSFFSTSGNIALLYASKRSHGRYVGITAGHAAESPPGAEVRFGMFESRGEMAIGRYALALGSRGTLLTSLPGVHPATATLAPPPPFYGEAHYREKSAHSGAWTGDLGVDLGGLKLPLAGPEFHARLCVLSPLHHRRGCDFFKAEPEFDERPARPWWMIR